MVIKTINNKKNGEDKATRPQPGEISGYSIPTNSYIFQDVLEAPDEILTAPGPDSARLYRKMLLTDPDIRRDVFLRRASVLEKGWRIRPAIPDGADDAATDTVLRVIDAMPMGLQVVLEYLLDAYTYGYSFVELVWGLVDNLWVPVDAIPRPAESFDYETGTGLNRHLARGWYITLEGHVQQLMTPDILDRFLVHVHDPAPDHPWGASLLDPLRVWWVARRWVPRYWTNYLERFGGQAIIGILPRTLFNDNTYRTTFHTMLKSYHNSLTAVMSDDARIEFPQPSSRESSLSAFENFMAWTSRHVTKTILGSALLVHESQFGTRAQSQTQSQILFRLVEHDALRLGETVRDQLLEKILRFNRPDLEIPQFVLPVEPPRDIDAIVKRYAEASRSGFPASGKQFTDETGIRPATEPDDIPFSGQPAALNPITTQG